MKTLSKNADVVAVLILAVVLGISQSSRAGSSLINLAMEQRDQQLRILRIDSRELGVMLPVVLRQPARFR